MAKLLDRRRAAWSAILVATLGVAVLAGGAPRQTTQPAVFKAELELVAVDVSVIDKNGKPVADLKPDQFDVTVDDKPRRVVSAQFVERREPELRAVSSPAQLEGEEAIEATYSSNARTAAASPGGRVVVIAIDQSSFEPAGGRSAAAAAAGLLESLRPADRVAVLAFPPPGPTVGPTLNRLQVRQALSQVAGVGEPPPRMQSSFTVGEALAMSGGGGFEASRVIDRECAGLSSDVSQTFGRSPFEMCRQRVWAEAPIFAEYVRRRAAVSLQGLTNVMNTVAAIDGPKTVLLISAGLVVGEGRGSGLGSLEQLRSIADAAAASQVSLYTIYAESSFFDANSMERQRASGFAAGDADLRVSGLQQIAGLGGGAFFRLGTGTKSAFDRVALELSGYYLLGIESLSGDRDGRSHTIKVRVRRPDVTLRSRERLFIPAPRAPRVGADAVADALKSPRTEKNLPIRVSTQVLREPGSNRIRLVVSATIGSAASGAVELNVGYVVRSDAGRVAASPIEKRRLQPVGSGTDAALVYLDTVLLTPARYTLRLAAADATGRVGSVDHATTAGLISGDGVMLSDLLLVDPSRTIESVLVPLSDGRVWSDRLDTYLEIYPRSGQKITSVTIDIADRPDGASLVSVRTPLTERESGARWTSTAGVDLSALPPGAYTAVARVRDGDRVIGRVLRPFRYEGPASELERTGPRAAFGIAAAGGLVRTFSRDDALKPDAITFFVGRMQAADTQQATAAPAITSATEAVQAGKFDEALASLGSAGSDQLSATFLKGLALFAKGQLEPAAAQFRASLRISSEFLPAAFYLGACYAAGGRDREAVGAWQTSLITESEARIVYDVLADALLRLQDGPQAEAILLEARGRWPSDDNFLPRLAAAQAIQQRRGEALVTLAPYIERHDRDSEAIFLALRLLYDARADGKTVRSGPEDRELASKYGSLYKAAGGRNLALVDRWIAFIRKGDPS